MSIFSLSLLFLSPIIGVATYILLNENRDPLKGFHDDFLKNFRFQQQELIELGNDHDHYKISKANLRNRAVFISFGLAIGILFIAGASYLTILLLITSLAIFRYWERGLESRFEKKRSAEAEAEFPSIVELFAVLVSAGESPSTAMLRVSERASGEMARNFAGALVELRNGKSLTQSLELLGAQVNLPTVRRFCDTLILAIERGTSLSEVLNRQVEEVRAGQHASLLTAAGKAEITLMIPVIFLILPISVLFALWPSYLSLGQNAL
ncbi:MAG: type II secretion system F family protein [Actinomycetes bacterium]